VYDVRKTCNILPFHEYYVYSLFSSLVVETPLLLSFSSIVSIKRVDYVCMGLFPESVFHSIDE
jgi:hypothetical protein